MPNDNPSAQRYQYDPDAPRHARLREVPVGFPAAAVGVTDSGSFAVMADPSTPPHLVGHALDYADRLYELDPDRVVQLIPEQRNHSPAPPGRHRKPAGAHGRYLVLILLVMSYALAACTVPEFF